MRLDPILRLLDDRLAVVAKETLSSPQGRDAFGYGRAVGFYAGLAHARQLIDDLLNETERQEAAK